jgi:hypothetical protein
VGALRARLQDTAQGVTVNACTHQALRLQASSRSFAGDRGVIAAASSQRLSLLYDARAAGASVPNMHPPPFAGFFLKSL